MHYIGEVTQICMALGIKCLCLQASEEAARALVEDLGLKESEGLHGEQEESTEDIIRQLSEAEKVGSDDKELEGLEEDTAEESTEDVLRQLSEAEKLGVDGKRSRKSLGAAAARRRTRSKGGNLQWNKSLNPDQPIT